MKKSMVRSLAALAAGMAFFCTAGALRADVTQEEVFQSINDNVRSSADFNKAVPYMMAAAGAIILCILINYHLKHKKVKRKAYSPGKLSRELCRRISLRSIELKQLKILAEEQEVEYPLTLILCPSLLGKAIRSSRGRADRAVLKEMVGKLREGLGG